MNKTIIALFLSVVVVIGFSANIQNKINKIETKIDTIENDLKDQIRDLNEIYNILYPKNENSLKMANNEPEAIIQDLGIYKLTAYCPCRVCCGSYSHEVTGKPNTTASGTNPQSEYTVAADINILPFGTKLKIGNTIYTVEDKGGAVKGKHIDIYFDTHEEALNFGLQEARVFVVE